MKAIELRDFGTPQDVCHCIEIDPPPTPGTGEVTLEILACPINPAEILLLQGKYASKPPLPYRPGIEAVGRITALGEGVTDLAVGTKVISFSRQNWQQTLNLSQDEVIAVPDSASTQQVAMLKVNPATAWLMLTEYKKLNQGDWVIQNAANSGVGHSLIQLAKSNGWRTVNVVRREELIQPLLDAGATAVLLDGPDLGERSREVTGKDAVPLAIDAVAGTATQRLADCLDDDGTVVNYGMLSGDACQITPEQVVFRSITLTGFWLAKLLGAMPREQQAALYAELSQQVVNGTINTPIEATYELDQIAAAVEHAARGGRSGKILLVPNGPV